MINSKSTQSSQYIGWDLIATTHGDTFGFIKLHLPVINPSNQDCSGAEYSYMGNEYIVLLYIYRVGSH